MRKNEKILQEEAGAHGPPFINRTRTAGSFKLTGLSGKNSEMSSGQKQRTSDRMLEFRMSSPDMVARKMARPRFD